MEITFTTLAQQQQISINICGTPCVGDCGTCVQSNADLSAFYGLPQEPATEVQVMAYAGDEDSENHVLEEAKAMDQIEEAQRSGEAFDHGDEDCDCLECRTGYNPELWFDDREDDRYNDYDNCGLDWNESGYFD